MNPHDDANDVTQLKTGTSSSGRSLATSWATSTGSVDHGRFEPGVILDNRYRVLGLLGRGGMGEVYRADDLRLGQQVALKFLPQALSGDPARLAQFHNEVRTARQVSHPNVCRVYDIGEIDGQLFITMEYVDGEDLSSLLRRIGRLPEDKGIDIARQICAGMAAAHERGVLHRDLKPANIMLDGSGRARVMDFSLAAVGEVTDIRAGTPAYMAPEQLAGQEVTVRSDIYAIGLVLYEIFTGRRAFDAKTLTDLLEQHRAGTLTAPTAIVRSLDGAIETAIVRCLDPIPGRRPPSAMAVSAALPGGDPLAAALAAGETPSPEMVAAAGGEGAALSTTAAVLWLSIAAIAMVAAAVLASRYILFAHVPLERPSAVLADHAEEMRHAFGYADAAVDRFGTFAVDPGYFGWARAHKRESAAWTQIATGRPAVVSYWYRTSPLPLVPLNPLNSIGSGDPPLLLHGMVRMNLDTKARLLQFEAAPPQIEKDAPSTPVPVQWQTLFAAAGLDQAAFSEITSGRTPAVYADERKAWKGTLPESDIPITVEAAAYRGKPVYFQLVMPWTPSSREPQRQDGSSNWIFITVVLIGAALTSYMNLRQGRADRRGAFRIAAFATLVILALWAVAPHVRGGADEQQRFFARAGIALFVGAAMYLLYLGLEPFVRRLWPSMLVGSTRALNGGLRDPLVGRDALIGVAVGGVMALLGLMRYLTVPFTHRPLPTPIFTELGGLFGLRGAIATVLQAINGGMQNTLINVFVYSFFRALFERVTRTPFGASRWTIAGKLRMSDAVSDWVFIALAVAVSGINAGGGTTGWDRSFAVFEAATTTLVLLLVLVRAGILAVAIMFMSAALVQRMPMGFSPDVLYAAGSWIALAVLLGLAVYGFRIATKVTPGRFVS